jgi:hypothetical protein
LFRYAHDYYEVLGFHTEEPNHTLLAREFEAGIQIMDTLSESNLLEHDDALIGTKQSLAKFRDDVKDSFPLQALLVTRVLDELEYPDQRTQES